MTDVQLHQENERRGIYRAAEPSTAGLTAALTPPSKRFRLVPAAVVCAILVVGGLMWYNSRQQTNLAELAERNSPIDQPATSEPTPIVTENIPTPTENEIKTITADVAPEVAISANTTRVTSSSTNNSNLNLAGQVQAAGHKVTTPTRVVQQPIVQPVTQPVVVQQPVTYTYPVQYQYIYPNGYNYTYPITYTYTSGGSNSKPATPSLETCGNFDGGSRWNDAWIILPKFERDGKAAVEYWVQVGTSYQSSDVHEQRYQQTDRVVFSLNIDNNREYYVRFRVKMENGDFQDWSDTFHFRCQRI